MVVKKGGSAEYIKDPAKSRVVRKEVLSDHSETPELRFLPKYRQLIAEGKKTATTRKGGNPSWRAGDVFRIPGLDGLYRVVKVHVDYPMSPLGKCWKGGND